MFGRDAGMAEAWLCSQEPLVRSAELGCTVDEVESLIKRHEAFQKSAVAWEERFSALEKLTAVRATGPSECPPSRCPRPCALSRFSKTVLLFPLHQHVSREYHGVTTALGVTSPPDTRRHHLPHGFQSLPSGIRFVHTRAETFQLSPTPVSLNKAFYALTSEIFDSWRSRRRNGKERGRRRNGGNSRRLQSPRPQGRKGAWWTARWLLTLPGTGEGWATWVEDEAEPEPPEDSFCVTFCHSRTHPRLPASAQPTSINGVCTDAESPQVTPAAPGTPIRILDPVAHPFIASCWDSRDLSRAVSQKGLSVPPGDMGIDI